jgi:hypothetical protein
MVKMGMAKGSTSNVIPFLKVATEAFWPVKSRSPMIPCSRNGSPPSGKRALTTFRQPTLNNLLP